MIFHVVATNDDDDACSVPWKFEHEPTLEHAKMVTASTFRHVFGVDIFASNCQCHIVREFPLSNGLSFFDNMFDPDR